MVAVGLLRNFDMSPRYRCPLGKMYKTPANKEDIKKQCREAAQKDRILLWKYEDCSDDWERQFWKNKAKQLYGE